MSDSLSGRPPAPPNQRPVVLEDEVRRSYLDYAMSVIVARALPDARDGLKPVHRRILFAMHEAGYGPDKPHRKSARVVGDVMGKYHPHGDAAIYDAMVRMAQPFAMRVPLVDGQGNFGSVDGDPPAAMRYTEVRLARAASFLLQDIDRDTVDFQPNYDESSKEPRLLPASFPNLLINGASGIAVGMATNVPTHNPGEIIDAALALLSDPTISLDDLLRLVPGPDFPTGGIILGRGGIRQAYETGRGVIIVRARTTIEEIRHDRQAIIASEIPYQVNKAALLERIADLVRSKTLEGISDLRDESDRDGLRIVVELKRDATAEIVLNQLFRFTQLQTSFGVNMLALIDGRPRLLGLREALQAFLEFRENVVLRRSRYDVTRARERGHLLIGLIIALTDIDAVIALIRSSRDAQAARLALMARGWRAAGLERMLGLIEDAGNVIGADGMVHLTEVQARGILELRLQRLTALEREKVEQELAEVSVRIRELLEVIASRPRRLEVVRGELLTVRGEIDTPRLTGIGDGDADTDDESLIEPGQMVVTITRDGFVKRTPLEVFRAQNRGGRGRSAATTRGDDVVTRSFHAHTHQWVLFFVSGGRVFRTKVWRLPEAGPATKGRALINILPELGSEPITAVLPLPREEELWQNLHLIFATASGHVRRNRLSDFQNVRANGLVAMKLEANDRLVGVATCHDGDDVILATQRGRCIRFPITDATVRVFAGRESLGVRGIRLAPEDEVMSLSVLPHVAVDTAEREAYLRETAGKRLSERTDQGGEQGHARLALAEQFLLTVTDNGFGKLSSAYEYRVTGRGGQGIANIVLSPRSGRSVVATFPVQFGDDVMLVTSDGRLIRVPVDQVRITGRHAMGVRLFRLDADERVTSVFPVIEAGTDEASTDEASDA